MQPLPDEIPVLTLPNAVFFPRTVMPLHIFEPRYRMMLRDVLATHRVFAVASLDRTTAAREATPEPPFRIATAGVIRACQKAANGTSDLLLEGLSRIGIDSIVRETPYRIVAATPIPDSTEATSTELRKLRRDMLTAVRHRSRMGIPLPDSIERIVEEIDDPATLCDLLLFAVVGDFAFKQRMLETTDTARRLAITTARLRQEAASAGLQRRLQGSLGDDQIPHN